MQNREEAEEIYSWIIKGRNDIQLLIKDLYFFLDQNRSMIEQAPTARRVCGLLIGASFSMWRAVFLVNGGTKRMGNNPFSRTEIFRKGVGNKRHRFF